MASTSAYNCSLIVHVVVSNPSLTNHVVMDNDQNLYFMSVMGNKKMSRLRPSTSHKLRGYQIIRRKLMVDKTSTCSYVAHPFPVVPDNLTAQASILLESRGSMKIAEAKSDSNVNDLVTVVGTVIRMVSLNFSFIF
jgi:hypothetical protein